MWRNLYPGFPAGRVGLALLILRVIIGAAFIFHGWPKVQNATSWIPAKLGEVPGFLQALAAYAEFGGGIALILGALTPLAALLIAGTMVVALGMVHLPAGDPFVPTRPGQSSYELAAVYLCAMIAFLLAGPGHLSVDAQLFGKQSIR